MINNGAGVEVAEWAEMKLVFGSKQVRVKLVCNLFVVVLLVACLLGLAHAKQEPVMQEVKLDPDFLHKGEGPKVAEPGVVPDGLAGRESRPQDVEGDVKLEPYLITMLDEITREEFDKVIGFLTGARNRTVSEPTFTSYIKFFASTLSNEDVDELSKRKDEFRIESIDRDDMAYTEKSEL